MGKKGQGNQGTGHWTEVYQGDQNRWQRYEDGVLWMSYLAKVWQYALGSYSDDKTKPYDIGMLIVRSAWVVLHIITCLFIIVGNGRVLELW